MKIMRKFISLALIICIISSMFPMLVIAESAKNEAGYIAPIEEANASAIKITTAEELYNIRNDMLGSYVLMNDIDLSGYTNAVPIGSSLSNAFHGKFDGQGHKIKGLTLNASFNSGTLIGVVYSVGLFGVCDGAQIKNVELEDVNISITTTSGYRYPGNITSDYSIYAGGIAGYATNGTVIYNCHVSGKISAKASGEGYSAAIAGGIAGCINTSAVSYCYNTSDVQAYNGNSVSAYDALSGGLVGKAELKCQIDKSYNSGSVTSTTLDYGIAYAGGLAAYAYSGAELNISNSFNEGNITGKSGNMFCDDVYAGGIAGKFSGLIDKSYNSGTVRATANDPYSIESESAYAGGICANASAASIISNTASLNATVAASSDSKYQYRIAYQGTKQNNITLNSMVSGSKNDADITKDVESMKSLEIYITQLGWDFDEIWEMTSGKDFPQMKQVNIKSEEYMNEYVSQHLKYIDSDTHNKILSDYRWAQIYWSQENNFKSNAAGALYNLTDSAVSGFFKDEFEEDNLYKILLAEYINNKSVKQEVIHLYELSIPLYLEKKYELLKKLIEENWKPDWGELFYEDLFWFINYENKTSDGWFNKDFEKHIKEIVEDDEVGPKFADLVNIPIVTLKDILNSKEFINDSIAVLNSIIDCSANVSAYLSADNEFKEILNRMCMNLPDETIEENINKNLLKDAIKSYIQFDNSDNITQKIYLQYISEGTLFEIKKYIENEVISNKINEWMESVFSIGILERILLSIATKSTWMLMEYITKTGEIQDCRAFLKANAYFEKALYNTLKSIETDFKENQTIENAYLFDAAFKFLKETEIYSIDTCITFMNTYQSAWVPAIKNLSNTFMNSAIEEAQLNKLYLYKTYCHGTTYDLGMKVITIACPTDVYIRDDDGNTVVSIENNIITNYDENVYAYTADNVKMIIVPTDKNYNVDINVTDNGKMNYSISEYSNNMTNVQATVYSNIDISKGTSYTGVVNDIIETMPETYNLVSDNSEVIDKYEVINKDNNVPVSNLNINENIETLKEGEIYQLSTTLLPANATVKDVIWSSSDSNIIKVSEMGLVTAVAAGNAAISVNSVYGGVSDSISVQVLPEGYPLYITKHPDNAEYNFKESPQALNAEYWVKDNLETELQWYVASHEDLSDAVALDGANDVSYIPETDRSGTLYYYLEIRTPEKTVVSNAAKIVVKEDEKIILAQPEDMEFYYGTSSALKIAAKGSEISYQWYLSDKVDTPVEGATEANFSLDNLNVGTYKYYCRVLSDGITADSNTVTVKINPIDITDIIAEAYDQVCDGEPHEAVIIKNAPDGAIILYSVQNESGWSEWSADCPKIVNGIMKVKFRVHLDDNHNDYISDTVTVDIQHNLKKTEKKDADCTEDGNNEYWICTGCKQMFNDENGTEIITEIPVIKAMGHSYANIWSSDLINHWYAAICKHSDETKDKSAHQWDNGEFIKTEDINKIRFTCSICGKSKIEELSVPKPSDIPTHEPIPSETTEPSISPLPFEPSDKPIETAKPSAEPTKVPIETEKPMETVKPSFEPTISPLPSETVRPDVTQTPEVTDSITVLGKYKENIDVKKATEVNKVVFTVSSVSDTDSLNGIILFTAEYDSDGKMTGVKIERGTINNNTLVIEADIPKSGSYKFMLWDKDNTPVIKAITKI